MRFTNKIYDKVNKFSRNSVKNVVNTSSDICMFENIPYTMSGASKIDCNGIISVNDQNVFNTGDIELEFQFSPSNNYHFIVNQGEFKFEIFSFNYSLNVFNRQPIYVSDNIDWSTLHPTKKYNTSIKLSELNGYGDFLIKGYYIFDNCTKHAKLINLKVTNKSTIGAEFGIYNNNRDYHFTAFNEAETPIISGGENDETIFGTLSTMSKLLKGGETELKIPEHNGDIIIGLNGSILAKGLDYEINDLGLNGGLMLKLYGETYKEDVLTFIYTNSNSSHINNLQKKDLEISSPIISGATDMEGDNLVYFNTTTNKYEIFINELGDGSDDYVITLNGMALAKNIDYYKSISNPKRIILEGVIIPNDIITVWYNSKNQSQGDVFGDSITISWDINNKLMSNENGVFTIELSYNKDFTTIDSTTSVSANKFDTNYFSKVDLIGSLGDTIYYRVKYDKIFTNLCGKDIITTKYSDVVEINIQSNLINSY